MRRRSLLTLIGSGAIPLAGCGAAPPTTSSDDHQETAERSERNPAPTDTKELPAGCPASLELGVAWPEQLNETTVASFVDRYEAAYYQQVHEIQTESRYSSDAGLSGHVKNVTQTESGGWRLRISGFAGINEAFMRLEATRADPPEATDVIPSSEIEDELITEVLTTAADTGRAEERVSTDRTDAYVDRFENLSDGFEITRSELRDTLYVNVDGTTVELVVSVQTFHADTEWRAWYYVDEHVVWRSGEPDTDPRDGELLECRPRD